MTEERFRQIISEAYNKGEKGIIIWQSPEEREKRGGNEEEIFVDNAFELHGYNTDGEAYGEYRTMELTRAIRNYFRMGNQFKMMDGDGKKVILMAFQLSDLISIKGQFLFAYRFMACKHLNGPIVLFPSCQVVDDWRQKG